MPSSIISEETPLVEALRVIDAGRLQITLVCRDGRLVGTITDGDIRRAILAGKPLDSPSCDVMNRHPITAPVGTSRSAALALMRRHSVHQLPIIDGERRVIDMLLFETLSHAGQRSDNWVVLMAGGLGSRLGPLTSQCPKPMIKVGDKPILETILSSFVSAGYVRFFISVRHMGHMIEEHFGDGSNFGAEITYIREQEPLGTAGALSLLPERPTAPFFVMNGDVLTTINFTQMMEYHVEHKSGATMCVREHEVKIPFGVVSVDKHRLSGIREKPTERYFVNAGIYLLDPAVLDLLTTGEALDMPNLFERVMGTRLDVSVFPLREYWIDVGRLDDLKRASEEYERFFG